MISVTEAKRILEENTELLNTEKVCVSDAAGRCLAADVFSPVDSPSFNNSAMDGYAVAFKPEVNEYRIAAEITAGNGSMINIKSGEAARIYTGAPVPAGADTVIKQEDVSLKNDSITFDFNSVKAGSNIRKIAEQCKSGDLILNKGCFITPGVSGLLSSVGITEIETYALPKVNIITTGSELINPGETLSFGKVYNSNRNIIENYLRLIGISGITVYHVTDDAEKLTGLVDLALRNSDVLLISGGISVGDYDFVHQALESNGIASLFYKLRQKPGKPIFAGKIGKKLVFGLPGNPASVTSCMNQYVKPCLQQMSGRANAFEPSLKLPLSHAYSKTTPFTNILKAKVENSSVKILDGQASFDLSAFAEANAFVLLPEYKTSFNKNDNVEVYFW